MVPGVGKRPKAYCLYYRNPLHSDLSFLVGCYRTMSEPKVTLVPVSIPGKVRPCSEFICEESDFALNEATATQPPGSSPPRLGPPKTKRNFQKCCLMELGKKEKPERQQPDLEETDEVAGEAPSKEFSSSDSTSSSGSSDDDDMIIGSIREVSYHPTLFKLYAAPRQRQEWGQTQILPRVNWGDLFFDLFYVAAAYNASSILVEDPNAQGCLYFLATFLAVQQIWMAKMSYDARFVVSDDLFHRLQEIIGLTILAAIVVHIRPVSTISKLSTRSEMFAFSLSVTCGWAFNISRYLELYFFGQGQPNSIRGSSFYEMRNSSVGFILSLVATILAAKEYFGGDDSKDYNIHRLLAGTTTVEGDHSSYNQTSDYGSSSSNSESPNVALYVSDSTNNWPVILILSSSVVYMTVFFVQVVFLFPNDGSHKNFFVPMNVDFSIHRYAEWTMLMLGESILSLLIVDVPDEGSDYYSTFYCSLLTVIFLQYLHFRSMPHSADDHAMRRSKNRGMGWVIFKYMYSCALVALGSAFTLFVSSFSYEIDESGTQHRKVMTTTTLMMMGAQDDFSSGRQLASGGGGSITREEFDRMEQTAAHLFSIALSIVFFGLDGMSFMSVGWQGCKARVHCTTTLTYNIKGIFLVLVRAGLLAFCATLSQWMTDPKVLAGTGLGITIGQIITRKLGMRYLNKKLEQGATIGDHHHDGAEEKGAATTGAEHAHAQLEGGHGQ